MNRFSNLRQQIRTISEIKVPPKIVMLILVGLQILTIYLFFNH